MRDKAWWVASIFLALVPASPGIGLAQDFPTKTIRIIVPVTAGGPTDAFARILGNGISAALKRPVIVENRPGASGIIGTDFVAKAPADGYTLLLIASGHAVNPSLYKNLPYETNELTPLSLVATSPNVVVAHPSLPANSIKELIALAKSRPGQLTYASTAGVGSGSHLSAELFKSMAYVDINHVPYKGNAPALNDLLGGHVMLMFTGVGPMLTHIKSGKLKALAVTSRERLAPLPDVPAIDETLPGYEARSWWGILGPAKMPRDVVALLNREIVKVLSTPEVRAQFAALDVEGRGSTSQEFGAFIQTEMERTSKIVRALGLQMEAK